MTLDDGINSEINVLAASVQCPVRSFRSSANPNNGLGFSRFARSAFRSDREIDDDDDLNDDDEVTFA